MDNLETLKALVELAKKATPGPWVNEGYYKGEPLIMSPNRSVAICCKDKGYQAVDDAAFISAARNSIPALEALLQEPSVPMSELEALAASWVQRANMLRWESGKEEAEELRSLINRSHK